MSQMLSNVRSLPDRETSLDVRNLPGLAMKLVENAAEGILITKKNGTIVYANNAFLQISGYSFDETLGKTPRMLQSGKHDRQFYREMWDNLSFHGTWQGEVWNRRKDGSIYPQQMTITELGDPDDGGEGYYASMVHDLTKVKHNEEELMNRAYHDALTKLPNRHLFMDRLEQVVNRAGRKRSKFAVMFIDVDNFKNINDSLGHHIGDILLKEISRRLVHCARDVDTVSRIGGDEFTIILEAVEREEEIGIVASRIQKRMAEPYSLDGNELYITVSIGIAMYPENGETAAGLLKNADLAMYHVKEMGRNNFHYFTESLNRKAINRMEMEIQLRKAVKNREMVAHYQPKIDLRSGKIIGMEALARWPKSMERFGGPGEFIPIAEQTGMIIEMDTLIMEKACKFTKELKGMFKGRAESLKVSVNLSTKNLDSLNILKNLIAIVGDSGLDPKDVELEVTESVIVRNVESAINILNSLSKHGFSISIDDFGTGYSSLSYLTKFPISMLKIDKSFVDNLATEPNARAIAKAIVSMAHGINIQAIAEGVESPEQMEFLRGIGCDQLQGYLFSKPLPEEGMMALIQSGRILTC